MAFSDAPHPLLDPSTVLGLLATRLQEHLDAQPVAFVGPAAPDPELTADVPAACRIVSIEMAPGTRHRDGISSDLGEGRAVVLITASGDAARADTLALASAVGLVCAGLDSRLLRDQTKGIEMQLGGAAWSLGLDSDDETSLMSATVTVPFSAVRFTGVTIDDHL